ncbi:GGDEF domain-containing protein [Georgenia sp. H159]|uniref:GGDEF domain-containing protein n=1 Tax=Georgenia sp. H159 TaxID=3076115 RepID=UPI002D7903C8|nr:diguanylate cyclase [Georgenia sp. H159]
MNLDVPTLYVAALTVITIITGAFVLEVASRGRSPVDLIWTLAFSAAVGTAVFYLWGESVWWFNAVGNAASVVTTFAMWNGVRADDGRRPLLGVTAAVASAAALAALVPGAEGGAWAGGWAVLVGTAAGAGLGGVAGLRGRLRHHRLGRALSGVLLAVAVYYGIRTVVYLTAGPESAEFVRYVGTGPTALAVLVLVTVAGFCMVAIRTDEVHLRRAERFGFDPSTGLRTSLTFEPRAEQLLRTAQTAGEPVALIVVEVEGARDLTTGFGPQAAHDALTLAVDSARLLAPPVSLAGREGADAFVVLLRGLTGAQAHVWADSLRRHVIATPLPVDGTRVRVRLSLGAAGDADCGYDLRALRATARQRLDRALAEGGNQVQSSY